MEDHRRRTGARDQPADALRVDGEAQDRQRLITVRAGKKRARGQPSLAPFSFEPCNSSNQRWPSFRRTVRRPRSPSPSSASVEPPSGTWKLWVNAVRWPPSPLKMSLNTYAEDTGAKKSLSNWPLSASRPVPMSDPPFPTHPMPPVNQDTVHSDS